MISSKNHKKSGGKWLLPQIRISNQLRLSSRTNRVLNIIREVDAELKQSGLNHPLTLSSHSQDRILLGFEGVMRTGPRAG
jgi:hypothetical protein